MEPGENAAASRRRRGFVSGKQLWDSTASVTHPSSTVSSAANNTMSRPSSTLRFSTCPRRSKLTASWNAESV